MWSPGPLELISAPVLQLSFRTQPSNPAGGVSSIRRHVRRSSIVVE
jgi:hypothetical protein